MTGNHPAIVRRLRTAALCALAAAVVYVIVDSNLLGRISSMEEVRAMIAQAGPFAGAVYFLIQLLTVVAAPIPSNVSMMAGALVLGFWPALLLGVAAVWLGSMLVFFAARRFGQRAVQRWVDRGVMDRYLPVIREKQAVFLFFAMLFPFFPDDVLCILAGLTTMPAAEFAFIILTARPWGLVFAALVGCGLLNMPIWGWILMLAALGAAFAAAMRFSAQIEQKLMDWITKKGKGITR